MENKNRSGIFLGVIGVATLVVAIIGATFAYFTATAGSDAGAVTAGSTQLALGFRDDQGTNLKANLIPATDNIAIYAANEQDGNPATENAQCIDDNANEVCSIYEFTIGNPNKTTAQTLYFSLTSMQNTFKNLYYAVYEVAANGDLVETALIPATIVSEGETPGVMKLTALNQTLAPSKAEADANVTLTTEAPDAYTLYTQTINTVEQYNKRTYRMIFWIRENGGDNVGNDENKSFSATLLITTSDGSTGVTGQIAAAG